jgi:hypothetical protein
MRCLPLLKEISEYLERFEDVVDGEDGPRPNQPMILKAELDAEIERLERQS